MSDDTVKPTHIVDAAFLEEEFRTLQIKEAVMEEREACARIADAEASLGGIDPFCCQPLAQEIAAAIRARR